MAESNERTRYEPAPAWRTQEEVKKAPPEPTKANSNASALVLLLVAVGLGIWWLLGMPGWSRGFSDDDIAALQRQIRDEWSKKEDVTVQDVVLLRKSPNELAGFVKLKIGTFQTTKSCAATADMSNGKSFWQCQ